MKKKAGIIAIALTVLFFSSIAFFHEAIIGKAVEWSLQSYCKSLFGNPLIYKSLTVNNNEISIEGASLDISDGNRQNMFSLSAEKIIVLYSWSFSHWLLKAEIAVYHPYVEAKAPFPDSSKLISKASNSFLFFKVNLKTTIYDGTIDLKSIDPHLEPIGFQFNGTLLQKVQAELLLTFSDRGSQSEKSSFKLIFDGKRSSFDAELQFQSVSLPGFYTLSSLFNSELAHILVKQGSLNGKLNLHHSKDSGSGFKGKLALNRLEAKVDRGREEESGCSLFVEEGVFDFLEDSMAVFKLQGNSSIRQNIFPLEVEGKWPIFTHKPEEKGSIDFVLGDWEGRFTGGEGDELFNVKGSRSKLQIEGKGHVHSGNLRFFGQLKALNPEGSDLVSLTFDLSPSLSLSNGWLTAKNFRLDMLPAFSVINGTGTIDCTGEFDGDKGMIKYELHRLHAEMGDYIVDLSGDEGAAGNGIHTLFFQDLSHSGFLNIAKGTVLHRKYNLLFDDLKAQAVFQGNRVSFNEVEAYSNNLFWGGSAELFLDLLDPKKIELQMRPQFFNGTLTNLKQFLSCFNPDHPFLKIPIEGNVSCRTGGAEFSLKLEGEESHFDAVIRGAINDGTMDCPNLQTSFQEVQCNFDYNYQKNQLSFSDIQGTVFVGRPENQDEYILAGEKILFSNLSQNQIDFDFWIGDKQRDIIRVVGRTDPRSNQEEIQFVFDQALTHFGNVHPEKIDLAIRDWSHIQKFELGIEFQLTTLLRDLQRLGKTTIFSFSKDLSNRLDRLKKAEGTVQLHLGYENLKNSFTYDLHGKDLLINETHFGDCQIIGKKQEDVWTIDHCQLYEFSLSADIVKRQNRWLIRFLGLRYGDSLLAGLEGEYFAEKDLLKGKINLLEVDFDLLPQLAFLKFIIPNLSQGGRVKVTEPIGISAISWGDSGSVSFGGGHPFNINWKRGEGRRIYIEGSNVVVKGSLLEKISAELIYQPGKLVFRNLLIKDPSGGLSIDQGMFLSNASGNSENWLLSIPLLKVEKFRPASLKFTDRSEWDFPEALVIKSLELQNIEMGTGAASKLSGKGVLEFLCLEKKNIGDRIISIPNEILTLVGVDWRPLNPVVGKIYFALDEKKIELTKLEGVYSEGKLTKFYFRKNSPPSFIEWDGNLNIYVGVKQHQSLLKIGELFTLSIEGNLAHPIYKLGREAKK
jgi:hypothetical protein